MEEKYNLTAAFMKRSFILSLRWGQAPRRVAPRLLLGDVLAGKLEPEVALLNASLVPDVFPVLAAPHKALTSKSRESLTTRTLHSELIYNYSGSKHGTLRDLSKAAALQPQAVHTSSLNRNEENHNFESEQDP